MLVSKVTRANISSVSPATGLVGTQATITGSGFGAQGTSQVQIGTQPLTVNTGAIPASSPRLPLALQLGTSLSPREPNRAMLFSFTVTGALSGRYNPTLTA